MLFAVGIVRASIKNIPVVTQFFGSKLLSLLNTGNCLISGSLLCGAIGPAYELYRAHTLFRHHVNFRPSPTMCSGENQATNKNTTRFLIAWELEASLCSKRASLVYFRLRSCAIIHCWNICRNVGGVELENKVRLRNRRANRQAWCTHAPSPAISILQ